MLASLYLAAMYGGSIAAILLRTPGTPAAAATVIDGYPMAQRGEAGRALGLSLTASLIGGVLSAIALLTVAPLLGRIVLNFGPVEIFAIAVLGITIIGSLSQGSTVLGLLSGRAGAPDRHDRHGPDHGHAALHLRRAGALRRRGSSPWR